MIYVDDKKICRAARIRNECDKIIIIFIAEIEMVIAEHCWFVTLFTVNKQLGF